MTSIFPWLAPTGWNDNIEIGAVPRDKASKASLSGFSSSLYTQLEREFGPTVLRMSKSDVENIALA